MTLRLSRAFAFAVLWIGLTLSPLFSTLALGQENLSALKPFAVRFTGQLNHVSGIDAVIRGNTIILTQPWVSRNRSELRDSAIYFDRSGYAHSTRWVDVRYTVRGRDICLSSSSYSNCYTPYQDSTSQAFLSDHRANLLSRVTSIEAGDSRGVRAAFAAAEARRSAQAAASAAFLGLLFEAMILSEPAGSSGPYGEDYYNEMYSSARNNGAPGWQN